MYPTAIGSEPDHPGFDTEPLWERVITANGITNGRTWWSSTGSGVEGPLTFYGSSFVSDPYGRVLVQAPRDEPAVLSPTSTSTPARDWLDLFPLLATRRPDAYGSLTEPPRPVRRRREAPVRGRSSLVRCPATRCRGSSHGSTRSTKPSRSWHRAVPQRGARPLLLQPVERRRPRADLGCVRRGAAPSGSQDPQVMRAPHRRDERSSPGSRTVAIKSLFGRLRPPEHFEDDEPLPYGMRRPITSSFPSGHAATALHGRHHARRRHRRRSRLLLARGAHRVQPRLRPACTTPPTSSPVPLLGLALGQVAKRLLPLGPPAQR